MYLYAHIYIYKWHPLVAQMGKNLPLIQKTQVQSLGQENPLEKEMNICVHVYIILDAIVSGSNMTIEPQNNFQALR